ncbi:O-acetyltransferase-like protein [Perkinsela sp. CCAP 1560/4]|nr:O-acetyltransferase-like protein [Perkinsela sp. CCAP 1560/4]|eukprot:KNH04227.1 O-acetyltransferase-like protein [Perkinsela sp. CCAP 1560/4]
MTVYPIIVHSVCFALSSLWCNSLGNDVWNRSEQSVAANCVLYTFVYFLAVQACVSFVACGRTLLRTKRLLNFPRDWTMAHEKIMRRLLGFNDKRQAIWNAVFELFGILLIFVLFDRTTFLLKKQRVHSPLQFTALCACALFAAACTVRKVTPKPPINSSRMLPREQTEEWKGWMQLVFLWYHYFNVREVYTIVRVCIASYIWLTGFGNFRYFYTTNDLSLRRLARILWRINFFPICLCLTLRNQWMLYYICALHSVFTVLVYLTLVVYRSGNTRSLWVGLKIACAAGGAFVIWDILPRKDFDALWLPLKAVLQFQHRHGPHQDDPMYEWYFRSKLDHFIWIWGMAIAFLLPGVERYMAWLGGARRRSIPCVVLLLSTMASYWWRYLHLRTIEYNSYHPFVSVVAVLSYVALRNLFPCLRQHYLALFQRVGTLTLECYLAQMHIWMGTSGPNGSAQYTLQICPQWMPQSLNFPLFSVFHFVCAYRIFRLTEILKDCLIPRDK